MQVDDDMFFDLAKAVYAGDLAMANSALTLMQASGAWELSHAIRRARQQITPLPAPTPLSKPIVLPTYGADPHEHFGGQAEFKKKTHA